MQDDSGVSRDELAAALTEVAEGRIPKDRIALRELAREMAEWPYADLSNDSRLDQLKDAGAFLRCHAVAGGITTVLQSHAAASC